jgi:hypothetical protein
VINRLRIAVASIFAPISNQDFAGPAWMESLYTRGRTGEYGFCRRTLAVP